MEIKVMQRIEKLVTENAPAKAQPLLAAVKAQMGGTPNIFTTMAHAPAALEGYLGIATALAGGALSPKLREQIAVAVAGANGCDYCASAHTVLGKMAGVSEEELERNLGGQSSDAKAAAALVFARQVIRTRGQVSDNDLAAVRQAGFSSEEIIEIVAHVGMNIFTNYFNHVAATEIDFPRVSAREAVAA
jgi:uncharacterized peroxidase-related enzyme